MTMTPHRLTLVGLLVLGAAGRLRAQEYMDRSAFVLSRSGAEMGRVEYAVRTTTIQQGRPGLLAVATTRTPAHEVQYALETTAELTPVSYSSTESAGGRVVRRVTAQIVGPRFSARASTSDGDVARELPVRQPFVVLGEDDYTIYYFLPRPQPGQTRTVNVVRTRDLTSTTGTVTGGEDDTVSVAGRPVAARKFELKLADGEVRQFWMTPVGSLVQVAIPAAGIIATRAEAPTH
jgi:hypothetical protein